MSFGESSYKRQPVFYADPGLPWELRLAKAYDEAYRQIQASIPHGKSISVGNYELIADAAGNQFSRDENAWDSAMKNASVEDVDASRGVRLVSKDAAEYYLGKFSKASSNIGAYISGYAREQVVKGSLSQSQFEQACDSKLRDLSDIIYIGRTGHLPAIITPGQWMKENNSSGEELLLLHKGVGVRSAGAGLGEPISLTAAAVIVVIVGLVIAAGVAVSYYFVKRRSELHQVGFQLCEDAVRNNDPRWKEICELPAVSATGDKLGSLAEQFLPAETLNKIAKYAVAGVGLAIVINFLPNIMAALSRTEEVYRDEKLRKLQKYQDHHKALEADYDE